MSKNPSRPTQNIPGTTLSRVVESTLKLCFYRQQQSSLTNFIQMLLYQPLIIHLCSWKRQEAGNRSLCSQLAAVQFLTVKEMTVNGPCDESFSRYASDTHTLHPSGQFKQKCQRFTSSYSHVHIIRRQQAWQFMEMPRKQSLLCEHKQLGQYVFL